MEKNGESNSSLLECATGEVTQLVEKRRELVYRLGMAINDLSRQEAIQFLFVSEYQEAEKDIQHQLQQIEALEGFIRQHAGARGKNVDDLLDEDDFKSASVGQEEMEEVNVAEKSSESSEALVSDLVVESRGCGLPEVTKPSPVPKAEYEPVACSGTSSMEEPECDEEPSTDAQVAAVPHDYQELLELLDFEEPSEKKRFEELLDFMNSSEGANRLRGFNRIACSFEKEYIYNVARIAIRDPSLMVRRAALKILTRLNRDQAADIYQQALYDPESSIRISAIKGLSMLLFDESLEALKPLLDDKDPAVRGCAVSYLGLYCSDAGISAAADRRNDPSPLVRKSLADILGIVKPTQALFLLHAMQPDKNPEVESAIEAAVTKISRKAKNF